MKVKRSAAVCDYEKLQELSHRAMLSHQLKIERGKDDVYSGPSHSPVSGLAKPNLFLFSSVIILSSIQAPFRCVKY